MAYQKVAISGATGNLGPTIVKALVDSNFEVTVLSQSGKTSGLPSTVKVTKVDYSSHDSIVEALKGNDAYVSAVPQHDSQPALIDAAIAAGGKKLTQDYLHQKSSHISWTVINTGLFLDWGIQVGVWANFKGPTRVYDSGNDRHSTTTLADIGKAVVGVLKHPEETHNRAVYVQSAALSQNELIEIIRKVKPNTTVEAQDASTKQLLEDSYKQLEQGGKQIGAAMFGFIVVSIFDSEYGNLWGDKNDNELLGIKTKSSKEIEELVASL
ncbi:hypothetical protein WHR41_04894 [Cladosporium halotolerans]|uniref:NmrA-like domain-containing protein n=1 Tax=Cladosporium halotolerans TaxID=1052096 RepID=A0AB34KPA1_9PEZI